MINLLLIKSNNNKSKKDNKYIKLKNKTYKKIQIYLFLVVNYDLEIFQKIIIKLKI